MEQYLRVSVWQRKVMAVQHAGVIVHIEVFGEVVVFVISSDFLAKFEVRHSFIISDLSSITII